MAQAEAMEKQAAEARQSSAITANEGEDDDEGEADETGLDAADIDVVMSQVGFCSPLCFVEMGTRLTSLLFLQANCSRAKGSFGLPLALKLVGTNSDFSPFFSL